MGKREDILVATGKLITEHGLQGTPISMIAKEANVGAGTIYRYFEDKEVLVKALHVELLEDMAKAALDNYSEEVPVKKRFLLLWRNLINYCVRNPQRALLHEQLANSPYVQEASEDAIMAEFYLVISKLYSEAKEHGLIRESVDMQLASLFNYGGIITLAKKQKVKSDQDIEELLTMMWNSIKS